VLQFGGHVVFLHFPHELPNFITKDVRDFLVNFLLTFVLDLSHLLNL
jgi:hypothetical protein